MTALRSKVFIDLNTIAKTNLTKPVKSLKDFQLKVKYNIIEAHRVKTMFGDQILVELKYAKVYLPKRFVKLFTDEHLKKMEDCSMEIVKPVYQTFEIAFHEKQPETDDESKENEEEEEDMFHI